MAMETLNQLPETASFQQIKEELEIASGLKRGLEASKTDQVGSIFPKLNCVLPGDMKIY